jgi:hypothetical protein
VSRFADRAKITQVKDSEENLDPEEGLSKYFKQAELGDLWEPATILDQYGRVMVWALPGVLHPKRLVGQST